MGSRPALRDGRGPGRPGDPAGRPGAREHRVRRGRSRDGRHRRPRRGRVVGGRRAGPVRPGRGAVHLAAPLLHPAAGGGRGEPGPHQHLPAPAAPARRVPRRLGLRPAALPRPGGPGAAAPLDRLRLRDARGGDGDHRGRPRPAVRDVLAAGPAVPGRGRADHDPLVPLPHRLPGGLPPLPGPGRRPRHHRGGVRARHPRAQGLRPRPGRAGRLPRRGRDPAGHRGAQGLRAGQVHLPHRVPAGARARRRPGPRPVPRGGRGPHGGRAGRVLRHDGGARPPRGGRGPADGHDPLRQDRHRPPPRGHARARGRRLPPPARTPRRRRPPPGPWPRARRRTRPS